MFKKLISSLPFNPSLIGQVVFYARRLHKETILRRMGLIILVIGMVVQIFAVISPPRATLAQSRNDIIPGGFSSKEQAVNMCNRNEHKFSTILAHFNVTCKNIQDGRVDQIRSTSHDDNLFSMGRLPYDKPREFKVQINEAGTFYMRPLSSWDTGRYSTYKAIVGRDDNNKPFMILFNCGNFVHLGIPPKPEPKPCPLDKNIDINDPRCKTCPYNEDILKSDPRCVPPIDPCPIDSSITADDPKCKACPYDKNILKGDPRCKPCDDAQNKSDSTACLILSKSAINKSKDNSDANNTSANAGEIIEYTLSARNTGQAIVRDFIVNENIADILDYSDVIDKHGGTISDDGVISWPAENIRPGQVIQKYLTVKIKDPIPQTPVSSSNGGTFDLIMTNVYGNAINVRLPGSIIKTTEQITTTKLPNTGPGQTLVLSFGLTSIVAYFFARTRLLSREVEIIQSEYSLSGGM